MPTEEELAAQEQAEREAQSELDAQPEPVLEPEAPAFDVEAERARIREQVEAEHASRQRQTPVVETPVDLDELQYSDPAAYRVALTAQIRDEIMGGIAPLMNRLNTDLVTQELSEGLNDAGKSYVKNLAGSLPLDQIQRNPQLKELLRNAAENVSRKAHPRTVQSERSTVQGTPRPISNQEYNDYLKYLPANEVDAILKDTKGR